MKQRGYQTNGGTLNKKIFLLFLVYGYEHVWNLLLKRTLNSLRPYNNGSVYPEYNCNSLLDSPSNVVNLRNMSKLICFPHFLTSNYYYYLSSSTKRNYNVCMQL